MKKIVVGGQIDKDQVYALIQAYGQNQFEVSVKSDLDAAMALKLGQADYYMGACLTGGGGALALALALLGRQACATVSMPGTMLAEEEIRDLVRSGKQAFGFTPQHMDQVIPIIMSELLAL